MSDGWKDQLAIYDYLLNRKFPLRALLDRPGQTQAWKESYAAEVSRYQAELRAKPLDEVLALHSAEKEKERQALQGRLEIEDKQRPHHSPQAKADYETWAEIPSWSLDEAIALSLDRDPRRVDAESLAPFANISSFAQEFFRRRMIVIRVATDGGLQTPRTRSTTILRWMQAKGFNPPAGLVAAVELRGPSAADVEEASTEHRARFPVPLLPPFDAGKFRASLDASLAPIPANLAAKDAAIAQRDAEVARLSSELAAATKQLATAKDGLSTAERNSLLKLVIGMAVNGYKYDPSPERSPVPPEIAADLEALGIGLDADTVRKYLREGAALLPGKPSGEKSGRG